MRTIRASPAYPIVTPLINKTIMFNYWIDCDVPPFAALMMDGIARVVGPIPSTEQLADCDAIIVGGGKYDGAVMARCPKLKVISRLGVGYDNIKVEDATARGILVCYAPEAPTVSTAEHAVTLMLAVAKHLRALDGHTRAGTLEQFSPARDSLELSGRTLGLVGAGRIGSRVARVALAMDMRVIVFDPYLTPARASELGVTRAPTLRALLGEADIVSIHVPVTPETRSLMNADRFAQMKHGAIFINTARGALVDESALAAALASGHLGGAGLDVFQVEPPAPTHPLLRFENVIVTPHIASATGAGVGRLWETGLRQATQALRGERPAFMLNPEVWKG
ncbi:MAG: hydroxyacid dehydrogenase [Thermoflexales bacterium]